MFLSLRLEFAGVAQLVEQLTCNQQVVGSTPIASSNFKCLLFRWWVLFVCKSALGLFVALALWFVVQCYFSFIVCNVDANKVVAGVPEWPNGSDCKSDAKASVVRIHPPAPSLLYWFCLGFSG